MYFGETLRLFYVGYGHFGGWMIIMSQSLPYLSHGFFIEKSHLTRGQLAAAENRHCCWTTTNEQSTAMNLPFRPVNVRAGAVENFRGIHDCLGKRGMGMDGEFQISRERGHLDGERTFGD